MNELRHRRLRVAFARELEVHTLQLLRGLGRLREGTADDPRRLLAELHLAAHALVGAAAAVGLGGLSRILRALERRLLEVQAVGGRLAPEGAGAMMVLVRAFGKLAIPMSQGDPPMPEELRAIEDLAPTVLGPHAPPRSDPAPRPTREGLDPDRCRVVVADDSVVCRAMLREILESSGDFVVVAEAENGMEALERTRACLPDLVLMDVAMPYLNGLEAARRIQEEVPTPVVLVSALEELSDLERRAADAGDVAAAVLPKPSADSDLGDQAVEERILRTLQKLRTMPRWSRRIQGRPAPASSPSRPPVLELVSPSAGPRVLLVEDSPTQADHLVVGLQREGFRVQVCWDASEGWEAIYRDPPDVVVSDVILPGGSGFELCQALKTSDRTRRVPVVLLTGNGNPMDMLRGLSAGAADFLSKPCEPRALASRLRAVLGEALLSSAEAPADLDDEVEVELRGESFWVQADSAKVLRFLLSSFEDYIRAQSQLEELRLGEQEARRRAGLLSGALEALPDPVAVLDPGGLVQVSNRALRELFGGDPSGPAGATFWRVSAAAGVELGDLSAAVARIREGRAAEEEVDLVFPATSPGGAPARYLVHARRLEPADERLVILTFRAQAPRRSVGKPGGGAGGERPEV